MCPATLENHCCATATAVGDDDRRRRRGKRYGAMCKFKKSDKVPTKNYAGNSTTCRRSERRRHLAKVLR